MVATIGYNINVSHVSTVFPIYNRPSVSKSTVDEPGRYRGSGEIQMLAESVSGVERGVIN